MSDNAEAELRSRTKEPLHMHEIDDHQLEKHCQHQNPVEHKIQDVKCTMNAVMDRTGCPKKWWLLCALFVIVLFNHLPDSNGEIPLMEIAAQIQDISKFAHFHCWQEAFVESPDGGEAEACWAVPAPGAGGELTCLVVLKEADDLAPRSNARAAKDPLHPNLRLRPKTDDLRPPEDKEPTC